MQPLWIDTDMGVDDALAIGLASKSPEVEIVGVAVVAGNVAQEVGVRNALQVLELLGRDEVPVYVGADAPLARSAVDAHAVHGSEGLGQARLPEPSMLPAGGAVDGLVDEIRARPGELIVVAVGPLTNLALAERASPGVLNCARRVVAMGGALWRAGNVTPHSEFNVYADPHALVELLQAEVNLTLIPLDITEKLALMKDQIAARLRGRSDSWGPFVTDATHSVIQYEQEQSDFSGLHLHDPAAVAMVIDPSLFDFRTVSIDVETKGDQIGHTVVCSGDERRGYPVECAVEVDVVRCTEFLSHRLLDI